MCADLYDSQTAAITRCVEVRPFSTKTLSQLRWVCFQTEILKHNFWCKKYLNKRKGEGMYKYVLYRYQNLIGDRLQATSLQHGHIQKTSPLDLPIWVSLQNNDPTVKT